MKIIARIYNDFTTVTVKRQSSFPWLCGKVILGGEEMKEKRKARLLKKRRKSPKNSAVEFIIHHSMLIHHSIRTHRIIHLCTTYTDSHRHRQVLK